MQRIFKSETWMISWRIGLTLSHSALEQSSKIFNVSLESETLTKETALLLGDAIFSLRPSAPVYSP